MEGRYVSDREVGDDQIEATIEESKRQGPHGMTMAVGKGAGARKPSAKMNQI